MEVALLLKNILQPIENKIVKGDLASAGIIRFRDFFFLFPPPVSEVPPGKQLSV